MDGIVGMKPPSLRQALKSLAIVRKAYYSWNCSNKHRAELLVSNRAVFERIYAENSWQCDETRSGSGSTLAETEIVRAELPKLLARIGAKSMLDAACGDCHWISRVELGIEYTGVDVVPSLIDQNRCRFPGRRFLAADLASDSLPCVDLILCRDCLFHLSYRQMRKILRNFRRSGSRYLLTTTFPSLTENYNIVSGGWRPLNLELPPFSLPSPLELWCENNPGYPDKSLGLWRVEVLSCLS